MDLPQIKQQNIHRLQANLAERFPALWSTMITDWRRESPADCAWLMYSANYLFRMGNIRWAMDPVRLKHRLPQAAEPNLAQDLDKLSFVILTHQHEDHLDVDLIRALTHLPITWIVPESVLALIQDKVRLPGERVIIPKDLQPIMLQGIKVTPFTGLHWEKLGDGLKGVPATGYLVEFQNKRWLFPGDTRTYDASRLPDFGPVDGLFAHLWLGRGCAARAEPPLLDAFCRFCLDLKSRRVILTHIHEFGRDINDFWDEDHAEMTRARMQAISPDTAFSINAIGTSVDLS